MEHVAGQEPRHRRRPQVTFRFLESEPPTPKMGLEKRSPSPQPSPPGEGEGLTVPGILTPFGVESLHEDLGRLRRSEIAARYFGGCDCPPVSGSLPHRCADHLQHATQAVIAAHTAFVERSPRDGFPVVT